MFLYPLRQLFAFQATVFCGLLVNKTRTRTWEGVLGVYLYNLSIRFILAWLYRSRVATRATTFWLCYLSSFLSLSGSVLPINLSYQISNLCARRTLSYVFLACVLPAISTNLLFAVHVDSLLVWFVSRFILTCSIQVYVILVWCKQPTRGIFIYSFRILLFYKAKQCA